MGPVRQIHDVKDGRVIITLPKEFNASKVEVIVTPLQASSGEPRGRGGYDFSDIAGKLEWRGDALKEQQKLRDQWK